VPFRCSRDPTGWQSGEAGQSDCAAPEGCWVRQTDASQPSYGEAFGRAGGGVWAVQYDIQCVNPDTPYDILLTLLAEEFCKLDFEPSVPI